MRTGNLFRAQRVWCALDLLLTCATIREARDKTRERLASVGEAWRGVTNLADPIGNCARARV